MGQNLELKIKVDSLDNFYPALKAIGAEDKGILSQKDIYYKYNRGLLKLRIESGNFQLIKYFRNEETQTRWSNYEILHLSGQNVEKYLSELFDVEAVVEKERKLFLHNNTRVHLDRVKNLGNFVELEIMVVSDQKDAEKRFDSILNLLQLDLDNQIKNSYRDLVIDGE